MRRLTRHLSFIAATTLVGTAVGGLTSASSPPTSTPGGASCSVDALQEFAPADTTLTTAAEVAEPSTHCRVDGFVVSDNPGPNEVNFMLALPDDFNGRYYMINLGGNSGYVPDPPEDLLAAGWAIAGTDTGNQDQFPVFHYLSDRAKALDQAWRGTHLTAVATQAITRGFYGVDEMYRYAVGCSGGGRLGFTVATNHPEDFDGVVAGAPGSGVSYPAQARAAQYGRLHPEAWISPEELVRVDEAITATYDDADGAVDGIVWDPSIIEFEDLPEVLEFLNADQLAWIEVIMSDLTSPDGRQPYAGYIFPGYPITQASAWSRWFMGTVPPDEWTTTSGDPAAYGFANTVFRGYFGDDFDFVTDMDFTDQSQLDYFMQVHNAVSWQRTTPAELQRFDDAGGKVIIYADTSDHGAGYQEFVNLYDDIWRHYGDLQRTQEFTRLFLAPGTAHCGGGVGPQDVQPRALEALVEWVENGVAPEHLVANRPAAEELTERSFLLCPYPQQARYDASAGEIDDASAWTCERYFHQDEDPPAIPAVNPAD